MEKIRLDKFLSTQLNISRTDAKKLIQKKRVTLFPFRAAKSEEQIFPDTDRVLLDGTEISYRKRLYLMLNKPAGFVSSTRDSGPTVLDLVPPKLRRPGLFPAGRLDKDTTGFVLITDDGAFAHDILSPSHHIEKAYFVTLARAVTTDEAMRITQGMTIGEQHLKPAVLRPLPLPENPFRYEIVLTEGRYHQIKRMFSALDNHVTSLHRFRMGNVTLDPALEPGACRELTEEEKQSLGVI